MWKIFVLLPALLSAASFDITSVTIYGTTAATTSACHTAGACNGGFAEVVTSASVGTGGTYDFGLTQASNNNPATAKVIFKVTGTGYTDCAGTPVATTRYVVGTHSLRQPYNNATLNDETAGTTLRFALSGPIFSGETVTVQVVSSFYTDGSANTLNPLSAGTAVTNGSTLAYATAFPVSGFSWPGWQRITGSTFRVRAYVDHYFGVGCVKFTATDGSITTTVNNLYPTIDPTMAYDYGKVTEYVADIPSAGFAAKAQITINYKVYPTVGDATNVFDTSASPCGAQPTPQCAPQYWVMDAAGTYGTAAALVDPAGNDSNSCARDESLGPPASACLTLNGAAVKIAAYNNSQGHNDACGTIFVNAGTYAWMGASGAASNTTAKCWLNITPNTGTTKAQFLITTQSGSQGFGTRCATTGTLGASCGTPIHLMHATANITGGPVSVFSGITFLWLEDVAFSSGGTAPIYQVTDVYITGGAIPSTLAGNGLKPFGGQNMSVALIRGVDLTGLNFAPIYTVLGNINTASGLIQFKSEQSGSPVPLMPIFASNKMYRMTNAGTVLSLGTTTASNGATGASIVNNIFENIGANQSNSMIGIAADAQLVNPYNNILFKHATVVGGRPNRCYQDSGASTLLRNLWLEAGNITDLNSIKSDTFGANSALVGNWTCLYSVGRYGNFNVEASGGTPGWTATGTFQPEFTGVWNYNPAVTCGATQPCSSLVNTTINLAAYKTRSAFDGTSGNAGNGDYHLLSSSPAAHMMRAGCVVAFDIEGHIRNCWSGSAGAFAQETLATPVFF